jgi:nondiscriminating glutamyl-tRNA synthetase
VRLRFAPSPTGHLHVGNARTALFNWLLARGRGGTLVLRIEDTDTERSTRESERSILEDLKWLGLDWDEGPDVGGSMGPYRQTERMDRYDEVLKEWLATGVAYRCFCTAELLETERKAALAQGLPPKYSGRCRELPKEEAARRATAEPAAVRFRVPVGRDVTFADIVRGDVTFSSEVIGDPVIVRSDGRPAYNFAVVVDDVQMAITHVIRGEDHISNTPRQVLMYEALGAAPPTFAHLSLVLGPDHAPLSKRHGATSVAEFRDRGYLPEALVNYLALLGWSPGENEEILPAAEMARRFSLEKVGHSAAVFDTAKLSWVNRHYMKEADPGRVTALAIPFFVRAGYLTAANGVTSEFVQSLLPLAIGSTDRIEEIPERVAVVFDWDVVRAATLVRAEADGARAVEAFSEAIQNRGPLDRESFRAAAARAREATGLKGKALFHPLRVALTAADSGPELDLVVPAIDRGAALPSGSGVRAIDSCAARAAAVTKYLRT